MGLSKRTVLVLYDRGTSETRDASGASPAPAGRPGLLLPVLMPLAVTLYGTLQAGTVRVQGLIERKRTKTPV